MTEHTTVHSTFTLERTFPAPPADVFGAWSQPEAKARWFATPGAEHSLDFRVGGTERVRAEVGEVTMTFESLYRDIVPGERIVYTSVLSSDGVVATLSLTTIELREVREGTQLVLTEQGAFLDGREQPAWREEGTASQLDALGTALGAPTGPRAGS